MANVNHHKCSVKGCSGYDEKDYVDYPKTYSKWWKRFCSHCDRHFCLEHWKQHAPESQTKLDVNQ